MSPDDLASVAAQMEAMAQKVITVCEKSGLSVPKALMAVAIAGAALSHGGNQPPEVFKGMVEVAFRGLKQGIQLAERIEAERLKLS